MGSDWNFMRCPMPSDAERPVPWLAGWTEIDDGGARISGAGARGCPSHWQMIHGILIVECSPHPSCSTKHLNANGRLMQPRWKRSEQHSRSTQMCVRKCAWLWRNLYQANGKTTRLAQSLPSSALPNVRPTTTRSAVKFQMHHFTLQNQIQKYFYYDISNSFIFIYIRAMITALCCFNL